MAFITVKDALTDAMVMLNIAPQNLDKLSENIWRPTFFRELSNYLYKNGFSLATYRDTIIPEKAIALIAFQGIEYYMFLLKTDIIDVDFYQLSSPNTSNGTVANTSIPNANMKVQSVVPYSLTDYYFLLQKNVVDLFGAYSGCIALTESTVVPLASEQMIRNKAIEFLSDRYNYVPSSRKNYNNIMSVERYKEEGYDTIVYANFNTQNRVGCRPINLSTEEIAPNFVVGTNIASLSTNKVIPTSTTTAVAEGTIVINLSKPAFTTLVVPLSLSLYFSNYTNTEKNATITFTSQKGQSIAPITLPVASGLYQRFLDKFAFSLQPDDYINKITIQTNLGLAFNYNSRYCPSNFSILI